MARRQLDGWVCILSALIEGFRRYVRQRLAACWLRKRNEMGFSDWAQNLRKWIDGEEVLDEQQAPKLRSKWEDFLVAVAREVEKTMLGEMFTPPGGPTYIPREYIVFLSPADDADWQGEKREGLQRGLFHVLSERAKELVGTKDFQTKTFSVELRVDGTLEAGKFRVQHVWDTATKTIVKPRKASVSPEPVQTSPSAPAEEKEERDEDATIVRPRTPKEPLFTVSVRRIGAGASAESETAKLDARPCYKDEITIGRGSRQVAVDIQLDGDMEVSRKHATLKRKNGSFEVTCHGANSLMINGESEVATGQTAELKSGDRIAICSYELQLSPIPTPTVEPLSIVET